MKGLILSGLKKYDMNDLAKMISLQLLYAHNSNKNRNNNEHIIIMNNNNEQQGLLEGNK